MDIQRLYSQTRKAIDQYNLINENDKIAVGLSGGKDSMSLLYALAGIQKFYPKKFQLYAVSVDLGLEGINYDELSGICKSLNIPYHIVSTDIAKIVFEIRKEENPCSLCAKMRKGAINNKLNELGINKLAYAHHRDDFIETLMLSLLYEGRIQSMCPSFYLDNTKITVIRPLMYVNEADIKGFINKYNIKVQKKVCPNDGYSKRQYIKELISQINRENPGVKERMFTAIEKAGLEGWNYGSNE